MNRYIVGIIVFLFVTAGCTRVIDSVDSKSEDWNRYDSEHYLFFVRDGSTAENDIEQIKDEQERAYQQISNRMQLTFNRNLLVYIYASREEMGKTDRTAEAHPEIGTIEAIYSPDIKSIGVRGASFHELSHIVAFYEWCPTTEPIFAEGLAVWLDDYWKDPNLKTTDLYRISKIRLREETLPGLEQLIQNWDEIETSFSYPAAGSFTKYLINTYDLASFKQLYCEADKDNFATVFFNIYEKEYKEVEAEYRTFLRNL